MAILTKAQLTSANSSSFPDNNSQQITPQILRDYNQNVIDTLVDSLDTGSFARTDVQNTFTDANAFTSISASSFISASAFVGDGSKLTNITASIALPILDEGILQGYATSMNFTGSAISASVIAGTAVVQVNIENAGFVTTSSYNAFTASTNTFTASANVSITSLNASSASQQTSINALNVFTASQSTASIENSITELNAFTASQETYNTAISNKVTALEIATASLFTSVSNLNASSASQQISINALNTNSASVNTSISALNQSSASQQISINAINAVSSSWITESETGSFVTTNTSQTITAGKQFDASIGMTSTTPIVFGGFATNTISSNGARGININATETDGGNAITIKTGNGNSQPNNTITLITDGSSVTNKITLQSANIIITGSTDINGALTASLQQGYVWVGNASGVSSLVATSSLVTNVDTSSLVTTASFNTYTASNDQRVSSLEVNSASVNTSITNVNSATASLFTSVNNINSATASLFGSASLALTTASFDNGTRNLTFTKGDNTTFNVNIPDISGSAGDFVTTASFNAYTQSTDSSISQLNASTASQQTSINALNTFSASAEISIANLNAATSSYITSAQTSSMTVLSASFAISSSHSEFADDATNSLYAQNTITTGKNLHNATIAKGTPLYFTGSGTSGNLVGVYPADAGNPSRMPAGGIAGESIAVGDEGIVLLDGYIGGVNTAAFASGDEIFVAVGGGYTNVAPTGSALIQHLGNVEKSDINGSGVIQMAGEARGLPNIQTGYVWVGDVNSVPQAVATSSFIDTFDSSSLVTTASFNAYTQSNDQRVTSLEANSASVNTSISALNTFTASQSTASIVNSITELNTFSASALVSISNINSTTASLNTSVSALNTFTASQSTASLVTSIDNLNQFSASALTSLSNLNSATASLFGSASLAITTASAAGNTITFTKGDASTFNVSVSSTPIDTASFATTGSNTFNGDQTISGSLFISGAITLRSEGADGFAYSGKALFLTNSVQTGITVESPIHFYQVGKGNFYITNNVAGVGSGSMNMIAANGANLNISASSVIVDSDLYLDDNGGTTRLALNTNIDSEFIGIKTDWNESGNELNIYGAEENVVVTYNGWGTGYDNGLVQTVGSTGTLWQDWNPSYVNQTWLRVPTNDGSNPSPIFPRGIEVTGSTEVGTFTASLQQGYVWVGNASGQTTTVATSSFGGGGAAFPYTGDAQISGSLGVTGSVSGFVNTLAISSNTASMNFNDGNFFRLQLVSGSTTHLTATNIRPGQTINLLVLTDSGSAGASGSLTFSPTFKFAGGFDYTPTAITASQDLVSFVTFDTTQILAAQIKNLL